MPGRLEGKVALVSGVGRGIGGSIAKVVCSGILMDDIAAVVDEIRT